MRKFSLRNMDSIREENPHPKPFTPVSTVYGKGLAPDFLMGTYGTIFPNLETSPTLEQLQAGAKERVNRDILYWQPYIVGMAMISEHRLNKATYFEHLIINEVIKRREEYLDSRVVKAELVERKR
jgi:hypothetical protein